MKKKSHDEAELMSWVYKRAHRSGEKIIKEFCEERQMDMGGLDTDTVRCIHSLALFEAARFINTPQCMSEADEEVSKEDQSEFALFLQKRLREHFALCDSIRNWHPDSSPEAIAMMQDTPGLASATMN